MSTSGDRAAAETIGAAKRSGWRRRRREEARVTRKGGRRQVSPGMKAGRTEQGREAEKAEHRLWFVQWEEDGWMDKVEGVDKVG